MPGGNLYRYKSLATDAIKGHGEFRILTLLGGTGPELYCELTHHKLPVHASLQPSVKYEALSWTWGEQDEVAKIVIKGGGRHAEDRDFPVRPNLKYALQNLRHANGPRHLWVDYVCIDQSNYDERASQVKLMFFIYGNADNVCVWLGEHDGTSEVAVNFVRNEVNDLSKWTAITKEPAKDKWAALAALMERPWFSRRWVVQELALAKRATVHVADMMMDWSEFETAVSLFDRDAPRLSGFFKASEEYDHDYDIFGAVGQMAATRLVHLKSNLFRLDEHRRIFEYRSTLMDLVSNLWSFQSQDPHDVIYAILSIAKDTHHRVNLVPGQQRDTQGETPGKEVSSGATTPPALPVATEVSTSSNLATTTALEAQLVGRERHNAALHVSAFKRGIGGRSAEANLIANVADRLRQKAAHKEMFTVNYHQSFFQVCKQFLRFAIPGDDNNLDILLRPWAPYKDKRGKRIELPSWIPTVESATFKRQIARHAPGKFQMKRQNSDPLVAQISHGSLSSPYNANKSRSLDAKQWKIFDGEKDFRLHVTGFVLDRIANIQSASQDGHVPKRWLTLGGWQEDSEVPEALWRTLVGDRGPEGRDTMAYYKKAFEQAVEDCAQGINTSNLKQRGHPILLDFLHRLEAIVTNRRLFRSEREHALGLAPEDAENGDFICIVRGMSVPVILRPVSNTSHYQLIGECYLHTMMDGRAIDVQDELTRGYSQELQDDRQQLEALREKSADSAPNATDESKIRMLERRIEAAEVKIQLLAHKIYEVQ